MNFNKSLCEIKGLESTSINFKHLKIFTSKKLTSLFNKISREFTKTFNCKQSLH